VKRVTAGNSGNPLPADGHPRPTVRLHSGSVPKDLTPVRKPVDNRHSDVAPAAATRQSRTAGAQRFVTPHRRAPVASGDPPSIPSSGSLIADRYTARRLSLTFSPEPGHRPRPKGTPARVPLRWCSTKSHGLPLPWTGSAILWTSGVTSAMELPHAQHHAVSWDATTPTKCPGHRARSCQNRGKLAVSRFPGCSPRGRGVRSARGLQRRSGGWLR